jgi:hypothetical protein
MGLVRGVKQVLDEERRRVCGVVPAPSAHPHSPLSRQYYTHPSILSVFYRTSISFPSSSPPHHPVRLYLYSPISSLFRPNASLTPFPFFPHAAPAARAATSLYTSDAASSTKPAQKSDVSAAVAAAGASPTGWQ